MEQYKKLIAALKTANSKENINKTREKVDAEIAECQLPTAKAVGLFLNQRNTGSKR